MFIFNGVDKTITIDVTAVVNGVVTFTPGELWSAYVDWSAQGDNLKYSRALDVVGGNTIAPGQSVGTYVFLRNDLGWVGIPPVYSNVSIYIDGSLYGADTTKPIMGQIPGQTTSITINSSSLVTQVTSSGGSVQVDLSSTNAKIDEVKVAVDGITTDPISAAELHSGLDSYANKSLWKADVSLVPTKYENADAVWGKLL